MLLVATVQSLPSWRKRRLNAVGGVLLAWSDVPLPMAGSRQSYRRLRRRRRGRWPFAAIQCLRMMRVGPAMTRHARPISKRDLFWRGVVHAGGNVRSIRAAMRVHTLAEAPAGNARSLCGQHTTSPGFDGGMAGRWFDLPPRLSREAT